MRAFLHIKANACAASSVLKQKMKDETTVDKVLDAEPEAEAVDKDPNAAEDVDYAAELAEALQKNIELQEERDNYKKGLLKAKGKLPEDEPNDKDDEVGRRVKEELAKVLPAIHATVAADSIDTVLDQISSNADEKKLIKYHFENSVGTNGTIRERLENAKLIANKKKILKTTKELGIALNHRQQFSGTGIGSHTETPPIKDSVLSPAQIAELKKRPGWDDKKIEAFKRNLAKNRA